MTFHAKLQQVQNHCVLSSVKLMDLFKFMIELDYLIIGGVIKLAIGLNIL